MTDRNLNIRVALSAANKLSGPVSAAQRSAAGLASQIKATQGSIKNLDSQAKTFDRLNASINKNAAAYEAAKAKAKSLRAEFGPFNRQAEEQRKISMEARKEREHLGRALDKEKQKLNAVTAQMYRHGVSVRQGDSATAQITRRTESYNRQLAEQQRRLSAVTRAQANVARAKEMRGKLAAGGAAATAGGAGTLYGASRIMMPGFDFDEGMSGVQALTRMDKSDPRLKMLREQARALGASTAYTATDAASGQKFLAMAGFTPESIKQALPGVLNMGLAGDMGLGEASDIGSNVLTQFGMKADQMDRVSDVLTAAFTRSNTDLRMLGETMTYAGPVAADLGISLENMAAMAGAMADNGIRGSMAGTALRAGQTRLVAPAKAGQDALGALGVKVNDAQGRLRSMPEILKDVAKNIQKFDQASQARIKKDIFGEEAMVGMGAVLKAAMNGRYDELNTALENAKGEADKVAKVKVDNLKGDVKQLVSAWEDLGIQMEESVDSPLRKLTQGFTNLIASVGKWMKANPQLTSALITAGLVIGVTVTALGALALAAAALIVPFALMRLSLFMLTGGRGLGALIPSAKGLTSALGRLLPSLSGVGRSIKDWPGVFRGGMTALGNLRARASRLGSSLQVGLLRGGLAVSRGLTMAFTQPGAAIGMLSNGIRALASGGFGLLLNVGKTVLTTLLGGFSLLLSPVGLLAMAIIGAGLLIWKFWEPIKAFFSGFFTGLVEGLAPIKLAFEAAFAPLAPIFDGISSAIGKVWNWFKSLLEPVETSKESLEKCTAAGETFGKVVGMAISGLMWPIAQIAKGLGWILEKLGVIPSAAEAAKQAIAAMSPDDAKKLAGKANLLLQDVNAITQAGKKTKEAEQTKQEAIKKTGETVEQVYGTAVYGSAADRKGKKSKAAGAAASTAAGTPAAEVKKLGDIIFKNRPPVTAIDGAYQEPRLQVQRESLLARLKRSAVSLADSVLPPTIQPALAGIPIPETPVRSFNGNRQPVSRDNYTFEVHFHGVDMSDHRALGELVKDKLRELMRENDTRRRSRLSDKE
ncbi:phage tail tape measure protein [Serratia marcescens]|uniref:Phage tail tape measure protein n=1 Tax=Serratia marcescens TaxID=615 RepID=A0ABD6HQT8_SERMA|nr:phage tail tape measure protein [Serratia marcescens]MVF03282.1 phage tail tape measure protein [Serratia marcescens]